MRRNTSQVHASTVKGQQALDVLLVLRSPRDRFVDHQILWLRDAHKRVSDRKVFGRAERFDLSDAFNGGFGREVAI